MGANWLESTKRDRRHTVAKAFKVLSDMGYNHHESLETLAIECGVSENTAKRWHCGATIPAGTQYEKMLDFNRTYSGSSNSQTLKGQRVPTAAYKEEEQEDFARLDSGERTLSVRLDMQSFINSMTRKDLIRALKLISRKIN